MDASFPSASGGSTHMRTQTSTELNQESVNRKPMSIRSSSQPATWRNPSFNDGGDGNWTYCISLPNALPDVKGFGNVPIVSYEEIEKMDDRKLKVCAVTWNVNEKNVKVLQHMLNKFNEDKNEMDSDIIFVSLQEIHCKSTTFHEDALKTLEPAFRDHRLYVSHRTWGQMVIVFIRQKHLRYATQPQVSFVPSGPVAKPVRTKGAIAVCFRLYQRFIVLIGCHLTHADPQQRINDYSKIIRTLRFSALSKFHAHESDQIFAADLILWAGDLNFRVTIENMIDWKYPGNVSNATFDEVMKTEELASHKEKRLAFVDFNEAPIRFRPTHKFEPDTDDYVPKRIPSFTDRVLFWVRNSEWLQNIKYNCIDGPCGSDHKPVYGTFWLKVINQPVPESYRLLKQQSIARQNSGNDRQMNKI